MEVYRMEHEYRPDVLLEVLKKKKVNSEVRRYGGLEHRVRCPYCGDSEKNSSSSHFYVSLTAPYYFRCVRCETMGLITDKTLRDLDLYTQTSREDRRSIYHDNQVALKAAGRTLGKRSYETGRFINNSRYVENSSGKYDYIFEYFSNRTGITDREQILNKFNIIMDPYKYAKQHEITLRENHQDGISFLVSDGTAIVTRHIRNIKGKKRYTNEKIQMSEFSMMYYTINTDFGATKNNYLDLYITEGIFDIINVYQHVIKNDDQAMFVGSNGKQYTNIIRDAQKRTGLPLRVHIYSDADVPASFHKKKIGEIAPKNKTFLDSVTIYYNNDAKD